ncbi:MAG TPA: CPBP family intramembrane glutamic endopeptidase [Acidimicrobiales bacterium]|nr:CPBP family intramembrane glutamic endopeptidase [Acidimicrobiales bacterium]
MGTVAGALAAGLASLLAATLVLVVPLVGRSRYGRLLAAVAKDPDARLRHYQTGVGREWAAVALVGVIGLLSGHSAASVGLTAGSHPGAAMEVVVEVGAVLGLSALVFRYGGDRVRRGLRRQARGFLALLPRGRRERLWFAGVAVTAGICEEILLRGFGMAYVRWLWPSASDGAVIAVTAAVFGLDHLYQGPRGVILTAVVGAVLGSVVTSTGSLYPAMAIHALIDLRFLALPDLSSPEPSADRGTGVGCS